jgi:GAF domain-containing protein
VRSYSVAARGMPPVEVQASNWITALGLGLDRLGRAGDIERLACEVLPNGTVIARDISTGMGYVVQLAVDETAATIEAAQIDDVIELDGAAEGSSSIEDAEDEVLACQAALEAARSLVPVESGSIILDEGGHLAFVRAFGAGAEKLAGVRLPLGTGVAGYAMQKRRSVVLGNAHEDPRHFGEVDKITGVRTREMACVPIMDEAQVFGVLELLNLPEGRRFTREDVHDLQGVANALGRRLARG